MKYTRCEFYRVVTLITLTISNIIIDYLTGAGASKFNLRRKGLYSSWKIDCENRVKPELQEKIDQFLLDDSGNRFTETEIDEIKNRIDWLRDMKCAPEPCLKVTYLDKERSLA